MRLRRLAVALLVVGAGVAIYSAYQPYRGFSGEVFLDFDRGTSSGAIAAALAREGVVRFEWQFLVARALRPAARLQAGEYRFDKPASPVEVLDRLARGDVYYHELIVPEGSSVFDIAASLGHLQLLPPAEFLRAAANPAPIRDLAPEAKSLEGYLFPSTYRLTRRTTAERLCQQMTEQFRKHWKRLAAGRGVKVHNVVTLASLVEKETALANERPLVAGVFVNRLRQNMRLNCDPTTIYAAMLEGHYRGTIYRSDLESRHPYNTYQHAGLPPGPIANPGEASLKAALDPAETDYLYFVARPDGSGGHQFSAGLAAHEKAVYAYRRGHRKIVKTP